MGRNRDGWTSFFVLENVVALVGILVAAILAYLGIMVEDMQRLLQAVVALLTALAVVQAVVQYKTARLVSRIDTVEQHILVHIRSNATVV